jgi:hypothetical protein
VFASRTDVERGAGLRNYEVAFVSSQLEGISYDDLLVNIERVGPALSLRFQ